MGDTDRMKNENKNTLICFDICLLCLLNLWLYRNIGTINTTFFVKNTVLSICMIVIKCNYFLK